MSISDSDYCSDCCPNNFHYKYPSNVTANNSMNEFTNYSTDDSMISNDNINHTDLDDKKYMSNTGYMSLADCTDQNKHMFSNNISDQTNQIKNIESPAAYHHTQSVFTKGSVQESKFGSQNIDLDIYYEKILGKGSFSRVFPGKYRGELVAVKIISTKHLKPEVSKQLQRELQVIRILQKSPHNNIASYYKILQTDNKMIIVMELCSGGELTKYIKNGLDLETVRKYFLQILDGYKHLIELDIVHRDIKAANILLSQDKQTIKFIDFGLSKICTVNLNQTICGSPLYMAPELLNHQNYDSRSDIWSLGVVLYEMVYGVTPFYQCKVIKTLKQAIQTNSINYPDKNYNNTYIVPPDLVAYIKNLLHLDPSQRIDWNDLHSARWLHAGSVNMQSIQSQHITDSLVENEPCARADQKNEDGSIDYKEDYNELSLSEVQERIHIVQTVQKNLNHQHKKTGSLSQQNNSQLSSSPRSPVSRSPVPVGSYDRNTVSSPLLPMHSPFSPPLLLLHGGGDSNRAIPNKDKPLKRLHGVPKITNLDGSLESINDDELFDQCDKFDPLKGFVGDDMVKNNPDNHLHSKRSAPIPIKQKSRSLSQNNTGRDIFSPQDYIRSESFGRAGTNFAANQLKIEDISLIDNEYGNEYDNVLSDQKNMASESGLINVNDINDMLIANVPEKTTAYEYISNGSASIGHYIYSRSAPLASTVLHKCKTALSTFGVVNNPDP